MTTCNDVKQRRQLALFNKPIARLSLISPYPIYTQSQLDMRRKAEILKYNNNAQSTKTNNLTKKQQWSMLVNGSTQNPSQYDIINKNVKCEKDKPMSSSASGVPGKPIMLQYDETIPLYNYKNQPTFVVSNAIIETIYDLFTVNSIYYLEKNIVDFPNDSSSNQYRTWPLGVMKFNTKASDQYQYFNISAPIALWVNIIHGFGRSDINGDPINNDNPNLTSEDIITITITNITFTVSYNKIPLILTELPIILFDTNNILTFTGDNFPIGQSYGIQYVGNIDIKNLKLLSQVNTIYDIDININYTCTNSNKFDLFQTGVFTNIEISDIHNTHNAFVFSSIPPPYIEGSFIQFNEKDNYIVYDLLNINRIEYLNTNMLSLSSDITKIQQRTWPLGRLTFDSNISNQYRTFNISSPLAIWINILYGVDIVDIDGLIIEKANFLTSDDMISINVTNVNLVVSYNNEPIILIEKPIIYFDKSNITSFTGNNIAIGQSYGMDYIGMLHITKMILPSQKLHYDISINVEYECQYDETKFDAFQTGIFTNITREDIDDTNTNFTFSSISPEYEVGSFTHN
jgi:hypothetical protein